MAYQYEEDSKKKKRYLIIGVSSVLLISMVAAVTLGVSLNKNAEGNNKNDITTSSKAIKDICAPTDYKKTCEDSLKTGAPNASDPIVLIKGAFNVTMKHISDALAKSETLKQLQKDPRTKMALDQCKELMNYAIDELKSSFEELGGFEFHKIDEILINLRIWMSAAISHESTCIEGFEGTQGDAGEKMKKALKTAQQLTHNALAIVSELSNLLTGMQIPELNSRRRLLSKTPSWVDAKARRLLEDGNNGGPVKADMVVALDGTGQYTSINEALKFVPKKQNTTFVMHIKAGVYNEYVQVNKSTTYLMMIGDGPEKTRISGNRNYIDGITTYRTQTVAVVGDRFIAKDIGFENTAGAIKHQAVALRVQADMAMFYNCHMDGYQDTLYAHSHRQFYRDCRISGTIDFLFGDAAAVFQNCTLVVRKPLANQACPITANGRDDPRESTGYVFQGCTITGEPDYLPVSAVNKAYLGRPWKAYSKTLFMETYIPEFVNPQGWSIWNGNFGLDTSFYVEFLNKGPGADKTSRVKWPGIKTLDQKQAMEYTPAAFIQGDSWIPGNGIPYISGMINPLDPALAAIPAQPPIASALPAQGPSVSTLPAKGPSASAKPTAAAPVSSSFSSVSKSRGSASGSVAPSPSPPKL